MVSGSIDMVETSVLSDLIKIISISFIRRKDRSVSLKFKLSLLYS